MFYKHYGSINEYSMKVIFENINKIIIIEKEKVKNEPNEPKIHSKKKIKTEIRPL